MIDAPVTAPYNGVGRLLSEARQSLGYEVSEAAYALKISRNYLEALEDGQFDLLPGGRAYITGYLRNYARFLRVDEDFILERFHEEKLNIKRRRFFVAPKATHLEEETPVSWILAVSLLLIVVIYSYWWREHRDDYHHQTMVPDVPSSLSRYLVESRESYATFLRVMGYATPPLFKDERYFLPPSCLHRDAKTWLDPEKQIALMRYNIASKLVEEGKAPTLPKDISRWKLSADAANRIALYGRTASWIKITGTDGRVIADHMLYKDASYFVPNRPGLKFSASNAGGLEFWLDGKMLTPLAAPGMAIEALPLEAKALQKLACETKPIY